MGALCCCFRVRDEQDDNHSNNASNSNNSLCPKWFFQKFINKHGTGQMQAISPANQQAPSSNPGVVLNNNSSDAGGSRNITILQEQRNEALGKRDIGTSRSRVQPEPVGQSDARVSQKSIQGEKTFVSKDSPSGVLENDIENTFLSPDDEDVCPTCFEEYTEENPKIIMKCSHHYHLGCIYEWMERSENCPVCREVMLFDESS